MKRKEEKWKKEIETKDKWRKLWKIATVFYILVIIRLVIFKYSFSILQSNIENWGSDSIRRGVASANFFPLKTIKMYIHYYARLNSFENLFGNIILFIPLGCLLPNALPKMQHLGWILIFSFFFITDIELFQLVTSFGAFDVDDIILNLLGVLIGFILYHIYDGISRSVGRARR